MRLIRNLKLSFGAFLACLILIGLLASTASFAEDSSYKIESSDRCDRTDQSSAPSRAEFHAAQDPSVDPAINAIVRELSAVGTGPRETRVSNPAPTMTRPSLKKRRLANPALVDEAAAARALPGGDKGEDDHAM